MCRIIEDMRRKEREEGRQEGRQEIVYRMLETGKYGLEEISSISGLTPDEIKALRK